MDPDLQGTYSLEDLQLTTIVSTFNAIKGPAALQGWSDPHHLLPRCRRSCLMVRLAAPSYLTVNAISPCEAPWSCIDRVIQRNAYTPGASRRTPE